MAENHVRPMNIAAPTEPEDVRWVYIRNGEALPFALVDSPVARRINGLVLIRKDLQFSASALETLIAQPKKAEMLIVRQSLWYAAIVTYAKCFVDADGRGMRLQSRSVFKSDAEKLTKIHEWMMGLRHSYIAHAGQNDEEEVHTWIALAADTSKKAFVANYHNMELSLSIPDHAAEEYLRTIRFVLQHIEALLDKAYPALMREVEARSLEEWYAKATFPRNGV
jgi:hypothetical protein